MRRYIYQHTPVRREPPPQRARVLAFIKEEIGGGRGFPRPRKIADFMGWLNEQSARDVLIGLCGDGHLKCVRVNRSVGYVLAAEEVA